MREENAVAFFNDPVDAEGLGIEKEYREVVKVILADCIHYLHPVSLSLWPITSLLGLCRLNALLQQSCITPYIPAILLVSSKDAERTLTSAFL